MTSSPFSIFSSRPLPNYKKKKLPIAISNPKIFSSWTLKTWKWRSVMLAVAKLSTLKWSRKPQSMALFLFLPPNSSKRTLKKSYLRMPSNQMFSVSGWSSCMWSLAKNSHLRKDSKLTKKHTSKWFQSGSDRAENSLAMRVESARC